MGKPLFIPIKSLFLLGAAVLLLAVLPGAVGGADEPGSPTVFRGSIRGPIGPVVKDYVLRVLEETREEGAGCLVFVMDTPGGLDTSMREIIQGILASPVPVVLYVAPSGARAASAGAFIAMASHRVAMAPGTTIGAAHPVAAGGGQMDSVMTSKVTNDAAAYMKSLAGQRGRNEEWAENAVRRSISSTEKEALEEGVIEYIAKDLDDLLAQLDGARVEAAGDTVALRTAEAVVTPIDMTARERVLSYLANPNIAYLLFLAGLLGIFFELQNPGALLPGIVGGICILLAFYAFQILPVNYAGVGMILLSIILFVLEIKVTSAGLLTIGGIVSMVLGSLMLIDSPLPFMKVSLSVIIPTVIFSALFFLLVVGLGLKAQKRKVTTGDAGLVGEIGTARSDIDPSGSVFVHGEYWNAESDERIEAGSRVEVVGVEGMRLKVRKSG
jgi:membrane-bound serine protease (ClpP class)